MMRKASEVVELTVRTSFAQRFAAAVKKRCPGAT